MFSRKDIDKE